MARIPLAPSLPSYRGAKAEKHRKEAERYAEKRRICEHVNALIANNPAEIQQYTFGFIAVDLRVSTDDVRNAIQGGGSNGITLRVTEQDRAALARYKRPS